MISFKVDSASTVGLQNVNSKSQGALDEDTITDWLVDRIAECLSVAASEIEVDTPLASHGLSSREAVILSGDLEDWLDCRLSPTLIWEHPTITALAKYLSTLSSDKCR